MNNISSVGFRGTSTQSFRQVFLQYHPVFSSIHHLNHPIWPEHLTSHAYCVPFKSNMVKCNISNFQFSYKRADLWHVQLIVVLLTDSTTCVVAVCSSSRVNVGLLPAVLINTLLSHNCNFFGQPCPCRFVIVPCSFSDVGLSSAWWDVWDVVL